MKKEFRTEEPIPEKLKDDELEKIMNTVYKEVEKAIDEGNPPFGAVMTDNEGKILAQAHNTVNTECDPTAHAEISLIKAVAKQLRTTKLHNCRMFINAESCSMCMTAIVKAKITEVYYGAPQEERNNPDIRAEEVKAKTATPLTLYPGIMQEKFMEQIARGREKLEGNQRNQLFKRSSSL